MSHDAKTGLYPVFEVSFSIKCDEAPNGLMSVSTGMRVFDLKSALASAECALSHSFGRVNPLHWNCKMIKLVRYDRGVVVERAVVNETSEVDECDLAVLVDYTWHDKEIREDLHYLDALGSPSLVTSGVPLIAKLSLRSIADRRLFRILSHQSGLSEGTSFGTRYTANEGAVTVNPWLCFAVAWGVSPCDDTFSLSWS